MLQHVWERASAARYLTEVTIATDDERIRRAAEIFSARVVMTRADHASGTDRVAEVASASNASLIVNIQGDEPLIDPGAIDAAVLGLLDAEDAPVATLKKRIERPDDIADPNVVKVVTDARGDAIYFSRAAIPFVRQAGEAVSWFKHIGLYVYRWSAPRSWNSCGCSKTGARFAWWRPTTTRSASIRRRTGDGSRSCSKKAW
jgi:3-deoxy-manno-octulosonate cytidylyltransferase (CMP-KDO synthetase)